MNTPHSPQERPFGAPAQDPYATALAITATLQTPPLTPSTTVGELRRQNASAAVVASAFALVDIAASLRVIARRNTNPATKEA